VKGRIEFRNVSFRYPGAPEKTLDQVSFVIEPGERVALLGRVGSGKSTILRLILGLYPPEEGVIMVDGTDIRQLDITELRRNLGVALQESVLLTGSVRENIALGREEVGDDELLRASDISGTHGFIGQIANGYDLKLADRGEGLSGGQRQSIALARALAGSPKVMLFDEPSSAMDPQSETTLIQRLHQEMAGRTMVLVTHRPPLLQLVTRIILVDGGKIVQDGPRDEVLKQITRPRAA
jgi:ATP-binding cassette subfamily C protein LapB